MGIIKTIRTHIPESRGPLSAKKKSNYCEMSFDSGETDGIFSQEESASDDVFFARLVERESPKADAVVASPELVSPLKDEESGEESNEESGEVSDEDFPILSSKKDDDDWADFALATLEQASDVAAAMVSPIPVTTSKSLADDIESPVEDSVSEQPSETAAAMVSPESVETVEMSGTTTPPTASPAPAIESPIEGTFGDVIDLATFTPTISNKTTLSDQKLNKKEESLVRNLIQDFESGTATAHKPTTQPVAANSKINVVTFGTNDGKRGSLVHCILCYVPDFDQSSGEVENIFDFEMPTIALRKKIDDASIQIRDTSHQIREEFKEFCEDHAAMFAAACGKNSNNQQPFEMLVFNKSRRMDRVLQRLKRLDEKKQGEFSMEDGTKIPHYFVEDEEDIGVMNALADDVDDEDTVYSKDTASFKALAEQKKPEVIEPEPEKPGYMDGIKKEFNDFCDDHATLNQVQKGAAEFCDDQSVVFSVAATQVTAQAAITYDTLKESLFEIFDTLNRFSEAFACGVAFAAANTEKQVYAIWDTIESWDQEHTNPDGSIKSFPQYAEA